MSLTRLRVCGLCIVLGGIAFSWSLAQQLPGAQPESKSSSQNAFSEALQNAMRSSAIRFRDLEGARIENRKRDYFFEAKIYLPEATYCRIFNQGGLVYCCEWKDKGYSASKARY